MRLVVVVIVFFVPVFLLFLVVRTKQVFQNTRSAAAAGRIRLRVRAAVGCHGLVCVLLGWVVGLGGESVCGCVWEK